MKGVDNQSLHAYLRALFRQLFNGITNTNPVYRTVTLDAYFGCVRQRKNQKGETHVRVWHQLQVTLSEGWVSRQSQL